MSALTHLPAARVELADRAVATLLDEMLAGDIAALADVWVEQGRWPRLDRSQVGALARTTVAMALLDRGMTTLLRDVRDTADDAGVPYTTVSEAAFHTASAVHSRTRRSRLDVLSRMVEGDDATL